MGQNLSAALHDSSPNSFRNDTDILDHITRWWFQICFIFTPTWKNDPIWRSYSSRGLKPPTRLVHAHPTRTQKKKEHLTAHPSYYSATDHFPTKWGMWCDQRGKWWHGGHVMLAIGALRSWFPFGKNRPWRTLMSCSQIWIGYKMDITDISVGGKASVCLYVSWMFLGEWKIAWLQRLFAVFFVGALVTIVTI